MKVNKFENEPNEIQWHSQPIKPIPPVFFFLWMRFSQRSHCHKEFCIMLGSCCVVFLVIQVKKRIPCLLVYVLRQSTPGSSFSSLIRTFWINLLHLVSYLGPAFFPLCPHVSQSIHFLVTGFNSTLRKPSKQGLKKCNMCRRL